MGRNQNWSHIDTRRVELSPWLTLEEACYYLGMKEVSFRKIAPMIGGRRPPCFSRELRFYKADLDNFMLNLPRIA